MSDLDTGSDPPCLAHLFDEDGDKTLTMEDSGAPVVNIDAASVGSCTGLPMR